ncbi:MFS transporter [Streptomyces sp. NPDC015130]|uniref:MFS transporter n=1 Tax=Streptomyces sp. NPDC015130 TaxID=3364940 RepID=UPI0036FBD0A1
MLIAYLLSHGLSLLGNTVASIALPWLVLQRTGDASAVGLVAAACAVPMLLSAVVGGVLIDRVGRRRLSVCADLASALCVAALPVVDGLIGLTLVWFVVLGAAGALIDVPGMTAREALAPDVAEAAGVDMARLAGLREGVGGAVVVVAPAAAGGLILLVAPSTVLWVTAACSALAGLVTLTLPKRLGRRTEATEATGAVGPGSEGSSGPWADFRRGLGVLRGDRTIATITLVSAASIAVLAPLQNLVLPVHLVGEDSPGGFGLVVSCLAVGGIAGSVLYAAIGPKLSRRAVLVVSQLVATVGVAGLALLPPVPVLVACAVLAGIGAGPLPALFLVLVSERIPEDVRGRVLGLQNAVSMTAVPVSTLLAGLVVEWAGLRETGVALAVAWCAVSVLLLVVPALRRLDGPKSGPGASAPPVPSQAPGSDVPQAAATAGPDPAAGRTG